MEANKSDNTYPFCNKFTAQQVLPDWFEATQSPCHYQNKLNKAIDSKETATDGRSSIALHKSHTQSLSVLYEEFSSVVQQAQYQTQIDWIGMYLNRMGILIE